MGKESLGDVFPKHGGIDQKRKEEIHELQIRFQLRLCSRAREWSALAEVDGLDDNIGELTTQG